MRQKSYLITLFIFLPFFCLAQLAQQLNFQNSLTDQGIINSTVYHSLQGPQGFIWFATESGVLRFDGNEYKHFTVDDGLSDNEVLKIHADSKNRIWFLTLSGKLSYYLNGKFYNAGNDELIRKTSINSAFTSFYEDKQHNIWFLALDNICIKISPQNKVTRLDLGNKLQGRECFFYEDAQDGLIIVSRSGFYQIAGDKQMLLKYPFSLSKSKSYAYTSGGGILFLAAEGIVHMQNGEQQLMIPARYLPATDLLSYLLLDKHNNLWINTLGTGTYLFADLFNYPKSYKQYLPGSIITGALHDNEDNIWFTTIGEGTYMLPANYLKVVSLTTAQGLSSNKIYSITKDSDNNIWLGMEKGIINVLKPNGITKLDANYQKDIYNRVNQMMEDKARNIWCATDKGTIVFLKNKNYKKAVIRSSVGYDYPAKVVGQAADKDIYYVYSSGIQKISKENLNQGHFQSETIPDFPRVRTFTHFLDQADSTLWFANVRGLHSYKKNQITSYGRLDTLLTQRITQITQTPDKILVLATHGYGIILFKNNKIIRRITRQHGLPDNICKKVFVKDSIIWVATNNGICHINYKSNRKPELLTVSDGIISNEINDIYVDAEKIYIATPLGLSILNNSNNLKRIESKPPMVQISQVSTKTETLNLNRKVNLSYDDNQLFIKFIAITFQDPKNITYQYRLKDDKAGWIETKNNYVDFSSLSTGNHIFEVRARKINSKWSETASFRFSITPPFWHTWWFVGLVLCLITLLIVGLVRYVTAFQYRQQLRKMETEQRLQHERERIARDLHDNVGSQLAYIINSLDDTPATNEVLTSTKTNHLREFTKQTINQLRETIWAIRQENISIGELVTKVQKLIWQLTRYKSNFKHEIKVDGDQEIKLSPLQALNLYRIVQEAINNVFNHSLADTIKITFNVNAPKSLDITIADNGIGFDTGNTHLDSYGLLNMQERANEIPAQFSIISAKGKGTRIKLKVDL
ncbi:ligand-binding sensor domain-containing protein [Adhaeribacter rhizoryzae]|uniref:Histidine kinase domain-containing protein n=1 Tax=Adhaeribacter rhizoryzae TaxID=2607907 RepID=A0A5M6DSK2_9BACT|nr:sensor histidine kinase [Adhaeribacter rhizoryzae]KAA5548395.1 hypothetical protein F0145_06615 [Adhaeribacter rhizoryzae]